MPLTPRGRELMEQLAATVPPVGVEIFDARSARQFAARVQAPRDLPAPEPIAAADDATAPVPGEDFRVPLRVYRPVGSAYDQRLPLTVFLHGGGWVFGNLDGSDALCRRLAHQARTVVVSVRYRRPPEHSYPTALNDARAALDWALANAPGMGVDRDHFALAGESAGGHLAAALALLLRDHGGPKPCFQLLLNPVTDVHQDTLSWAEYGHGHVLTREYLAWCVDQLLGEGWRDRPLPRYAAPLRAPDLTGLPRTVVVTAECDPLRDEGEQYARRIKHAGGTAAVIPAPGGFHGFFTLWDALPVAAEVSERAFAALREGFDDAVRLTRSRDARAATSAITPAGQSHG